MTTSQATDADEVDYSAAATLIKFDRPLPLLRGPIRAGPTDDPSKGPHLLAFRNPQSLFSAHKLCLSKLLEQCEAGVRIGCSIAASDKCKPPWWKSFLGGSVDFKERERCEEREMANCLQESKGKCVKFADEKCEKAFRTARVATRGRWTVGEKEAAELIGWISMSDLKTVSQLGPFAGSNFVYEMTNCKASDLLGDDLMINHSIED